ncbi:MAG: hypothetical protein IJG36_04340 [Synergistaceae bacterium]|nr:hypothetical protein [Synergistaceae bacterium]
MRKFLSLAIDEELLQQLHSVAAYKQLVTRARYSPTAVINEAVKNYLQEYEEILKEE